jgi:ATP-dependent helicase/nuclease subunit B
MNAKISTFYQERRRDMLRIIKSGFGGGGEMHMRSLIVASVTENKPCYLIVPEQQTVMAEGEMARILPKNAPLFFEATNFTRLANTVFRALGGLSGELCDSGKRALIMWRALTELSPMLDMTGRGEVSAGLVEQALRAVTEMENLSITPDELLKSKDKVSDDGRLASKLSDLSRVYSLYKNLLREKYSDQGEAIELVIEKLRENEDFLSGTEIYIEGFTSFTEGQYRLIGALAKRTLVTLHLPLPKIGSDSFEYKEITKAEHRLKRAAARESADIKILHEDGRCGTNSELLSELPRKIWQINPKIDNTCLQNIDKTEELRIFEAATPFEECDFVASDIRRRIMGGAKDSDFAIIARRAESYEGILDGALQMAEVPYFSSVRTDVTSFEAIKLILTAFSVVSHGYRREDIITYAKCGFSGITREECDELEIYSAVWQINGTRWTDGSTWNMNPGGYTARKTEKTAEKLLRINDIKTRLITPLLVFEENIKSAKTVKEAAEALMTFLLEIKLEHAIKRQSEVLRARGEITLSGEMSSLWKLIINSLDSMVEVMGDLPAGPDSFLSQLKALFTYANLGRIPSFADQVTVGSADMLRLSGKKQVYLIGVNRGQFPEDVSDSSFFSDKDRERLSEAGLEIAPELEIKNARELFILSRAIASASEGVTLLYTSSDTKFKRVERAEVIDKIIKLTDGRVTPRRISDMSAKERLYSPRATLNTLDTVTDLEYTEVAKALKNSGYQELLSISEGDIKNTSLSLGDALSDRLYKRKIALTQSRLDSFVNCPLSYFLKYTLSLNMEKPAEFDAPSIGSFIHGCLENFFRTARDNGIRPESMTKEEREALTRDSAKKYLSELGEDVMSTRTEIKIKRLTRSAIPIIDGLCRELSASRFSPRFFELKIASGEPDSPSPLHLKTEDDRDVYLYGIIDRVDTYEQDGNVYVRVIDYKTGAKEFSPDDMEKGRNLQMFLYLKAIMDTEKQAFRKKLGVTDDGKIIPAGVIYVKTSLADAQIDRSSDEDALAAIMKNQTREGMALNDEVSLAAFGEDYIPSHTKRDSDRYLYTEEGFGQLMEKVERSVVKIAEGIKGGEAKADPNLDGQYSPCDFCDYKPVCRNAKLKK